MHDPLIYFVALGVSGLFASEAEASSGSAWFSYRVRRVPICQNLKETTHFSEPNSDTRCCVRARRLQLWSFPANRNDDGLWTVRETAFWFGAVLQAPVGAFCASTGASPSTPLTLAVLSTCSKWQPSRRSNWIRS